MDGSLTLQTGFPFSMMLSSSQKFDFEFESF